MPPTTNKAAWIKSKQAHPFVVDDAPMPDPGPDLITVRVHAAAVNPADAKIQELGMIISDYPAVLGCDAAGEVVAVGSNVKDFKVGDRVAGSCDHAADLAGKGTFQLYCNLRAELSGKIPDNLEYKDACVLPLGLNTAAYSLFEKSALALPLPQTEPKPNGKVLLIWSGASSVGTAGIQMAKAAGFEVAATAGPHNLDYLKSVGADYVFSYKSETVVEEVVQALKGKEMAGAFNTVFSADGDQKCAEILHQLGGEQMVASVVPHVMPYTRDLPHGVKFADCDSSHIRFSNVADEIYKRWLPAALANGTLKCKPDPVLVGKGLESCQAAVDRVLKASAQKFVIEF